MDDEGQINEIIEGAKAVQEAAKATGKVVDGLGDAGKFLGRVFGPLVVNGVGIIADRVKFYRIEQAIKLSEKTKKILKDRGIEDQTRSVHPKIAIPLIENATLEDNETLHSLWAQLLANAMDPNYKHDITPMHVSIMKELQPNDVIILSTILQFIKKADRFNFIYHFKLTRSHVTHLVRKFKNIELSNKDVDLSFLNLERLSIIKKVTGEIHLEKTVEAIYDMIKREEYLLTAFGISLLRATFINSNEFT